MAQVTVPIAVNADDQDVYRGAATWAAVPSAVNAWEDLQSIVADRGLSAGTYYIQPSLLRFNTGSYLADNAIVSAASLIIYPTARVDAGEGRSYTWGWAYWDGTRDADWTNVVETNAHAGTLLTALTLNTDNTLALSNVGNISTIGYSYLRGHISGGQPAGDNYVAIPSIQHGTLFASSPRLLITYSVDTTPPANPTGLTASVIGG